jgi:hypothetical protein
MCQATRSRTLSLFVIGLCLSLLLAACQADETPETLTRDIGAATTPGMVETPTPAASDRQLTPQNTATPTHLPVPTVTAIATLRPPRSTPSATSSPTLTATRTSFGGWLVFSSRRQDTNEDGVIDLSDGVHLYSLNLSTQELTQLTSGNHRDLHPAWSPDRSQIAFASNRDGNYELYVMNADGSEVRRFTNTPEDETKPRWSPDGMRIVYVQVKTVEFGLQEKRLYLISATGDDIQRLTSGLEDDDPDWSPDGRFLAFVRSVYIPENEGSSSTLSLYRATSVYLMDLQGEQLFKLTLHARESGRSTFDYPQWLPRDGHFLSMVHVPGDEGSVDIKVFELLWEDGQPALYRVFAIASAYGAAVWGPNGEWLISIDSNDQYFGTVPNEALNDLILLPVDFSTQHRAIAAGPTAGSSYNYSLDEGELITNDTYYDDYPDWSP